jgi:hypothetical protein
MRPNLPKYISYSRSLLYFPKQKWTHHLLMLTNVVSLRMIFSRKCQFRTSHRNNWPWCTYVHMPEKENDTTLVSSSVLMCNRLWAESGYEFTWLREIQLSSSWLQTATIAGTRKQCSTMKGNPCFYCIGHGWRSLPRDVALNDWLPKFHWESSNWPVTNTGAMYRRCKLLESGHLATWLVP